MRRFGHPGALLWLVALWVALWGEVTAANVVAGLVVAIGVGLAFPRAAPRPAHLVRPLRLLRFLGYFVVKVVEANAIVAWEVVTPRSRINQGIVAVSMHCPDDIVVTALANTISLTPGTLTIEVRRAPHPVLYVHVLHLRGIAEARRDVLYLEYLLVRALRPRQEGAIAQIERELRAGAQEEERT